MAQQNFKIIDRTNGEHNPKEFAFFSQNRYNYRTCTKNKTKEEYYVFTTYGRYGLIFFNLDEAKKVLYSEEKFEIGGLLETDSQEEIEKITPENIEDKSNEFLTRFNRNFKLNVNYLPNEIEIDTINEKVKKTVWNKENIFLLNFYMMEVCKRKYNYQWKFKIINTFNPFYILELLENNNILTIEFYRELNPKLKSIYDFKKYIDDHKKYTLNSDGSVSYKKE